MKLQENLLRAVILNSINLILTVYKSDFKTAIVKKIWQNNWPRSTLVQAGQKYQMGNTIHNLVTMMRFNNSTMKSERFPTEGIRKAPCNLPLQMCQCLQCYVLVDVIPCSLALEKVSLLLPEAIPTTETALNNF